MDFGKGYFKTFEQGLEREWVVTNGLGSYAGSSIIAANTRKHHGYLIASLRSPVKRHLILAKTDEKIVLEGKTYDLATNRRPMWIESGQDFLQRFHYTTHPIFTYQAEGTFIEKSIILERHKNTVLVSYKVTTGSKAADLYIKPLYNFRDHNQRSERAGLNFDTSINGSDYSLIPHANRDINIKTYLNDGKIIQSESNYDEDMMYDTEIATGMTAIDNHYTPIEYLVHQEAYTSKTYNLICSIEDKPNRDASSIRNNYLSYYEALRLQSGYIEGTMAHLVHASDQFIVDRTSTGLKTVLAGLPWFADWGRDTMIALQGLTLPTKRFDDARDVLLTFAKYVHKGLVPNMFPDEGSDPLYNTVDASLWYFYSVDQYLKYTGSDSDYAFIKEHIFPKLKEIITAYKNGTDFSIYMDDDSLIHAGSGVDQVTWMDVRVGEWVVTPRHGKPVEINALWYNALKVVEKLCEYYGEKSTSYRILSDRVRESFNAKFWNASENCLYDVVDKNDPKVRPNQIWAVSLPYMMLDKEKAKAVVHKVVNELYATYGLRSLSPKDPEYKGIYKGKLIVRDGAYHQGTSWGFPLGGLITAYTKVYDHTPEAIAYAKKLLDPIEDHLRDGCIGSIAEIFDGDAPNISRGCYAQAWSVGEVLRAYHEDIIPYL